MALRSSSSAAGTDAAAQDFSVTAHMVIRSVRAEDLPKLEWFGAFAHFRDLYQRTWQDHQAGRRLMLVADLNGFPVGQVWVDVTPSDYAYLYALRVMEPLQGIGIGTRLIASAEALARSHFYRQMQLAVEKTNLGARRLYERLGYHVFSQRVDVWSYTGHLGETHWVQEDVYGMRKLL